MQVGSLPKLQYNRKFHSLNLPVQSSDLTMMRVVSGKGGSLKRRGKEGWIYERVDEMNHDGDRGEDSASESRQKGSPRPSSLSLPLSLKTMAVTPSNCLLPPSMNRSLVLHPSQATRASTGITTRLQKQEPVFLFKSETG